MEVTRFLFVGVSLVSVGMLLDRLLTRPDKVKLHGALLALWFKIEETRFPELGSRIAARVVKAIRVSFDRTNLRQTVIRLVFLSWLFTSLAGSIGAFMDGSAELNPYSWLPIFPVYFVNGFFDAVTICITFFLLRLAARSRSWATVSLVAMNATIAALIAVLSLPLLTWSHHEAHVRNWPGSGNSRANMLDFSEIGFALEDSLRPEIEKHLREKGAVPFIFKQEKWKGLDDVEAQNIEARFDFTPGTTVEKYRLERAIVKRHVRRNHETVSNFEFIPAKTFSQSYISSVKKILTDIKHWSPRLEGSMKASGPEWSASANFASFGSGKWSFILVAGTTLIPAVVLAFVLCLLAGLKAARDLTAFATNYFIERTTEEDPKNSPEKFTPFTLLFTVIGVLLYLVRELSLWVVEKLT